MTASAQLDLRIDFTGTLAALVAAFPTPLFPPGTWAWTTDMGFVNWNGTSWGMSTAATVAANATATQASGTAIAARINNVTSAGSAYSVTLPPSVPGMQITISTSTATNTVAVFPNAGGTTTETINALAANGGITLAARTAAIFICVVAGQWYTVPRVPS